MMMIFFNSGEFFFWISSRLFHSCKILYCYINAEESWWLASLTDPDYKHKTQSAFVAMAADLIGGD